MVLLQAQLDSDMDDSPDNLARLAHLTRDSIMNALQARYERNQIYVSVAAAWKTQREVREIEREKEKKKRRKEIVALLK